MSRLAPNQERLKGWQFRDFRDALLSAYGDPESFGQMLQFQLTKRLSSITTDSGMENIIFRVIQKAEDQAWTLELLVGARAESPGNPELFAFAQQFGLTPRVYEQNAGKLVSDQPVDRLRLEKIVNGSNGLKDVVQWRHQLGLLEGRVCRVEITVGTTLETGTGFLISPSAVITNYHVMELVHRKLVDPSQVILRFDYKQSIDGVTVNSGTEYRLASDWLIDYSPMSKHDFAGNEPLPDELDYALLRVDGQPGKDPIGGADVGSPDATIRGWIVPPSTPHELKPNMALFILQHPRGRPLQLALDTNAVIKCMYDGRRVRYRTNTDEGSSGSPCFDDNWNLVALHHLGDPGFNPEGKPLFNQGIPYAAIQRLLSERRKDLEIGA